MQNNNPNDPNQNPSQNPQQNFFQQSLNNNQYYQERPSWDASNELQFQQFNPSFHAPMSNFDQPNHVQHQYQLQNHPQNHLVQQPLHQDFNPHFQKPPPRRRKRNFTACEPCRVKKIKCNLDKPTCGSCSKSGTACVYRSSVNSEKAAAKTNPSGVSDNEQKPKHEDSPSIQIPTQTQKVASTSPSNLKPSEISKLVESQSTPEKWSSCNWIANAEDFLTWPVLENKYKLTKPINTVLSEITDLGLPNISIFTIEEINELLQNFINNLVIYVKNFNENVQSKNLLVDFKNLQDTVEFVLSSSKYPNFNLLNLKFPDNLLPLPILLMITAGSLIAKPLTFTNLIDFKSSLAQKSNVFELSFKYYTLANYLNGLPQYKVHSFNIKHTQFLLLNASFWMYNMKPFKGWDFIYKSSISVMTILETLKNSQKKFTEQQHRTLEQVFYTCIRYESELRVELSPTVPSSGIVNYKFPKLYPTPPLNGSMEINEELSWFYILTEILFRRFENRILDEFYLSTFKSVNYNKDVKNDSYLNDEHSLNWENLDFEETSKKIDDYFAEIAQIEKLVQSHLDSILDADEYNTDYISRPQGLAFKKVQLTDNSNQVNTEGDKNINKADLPMTPNSASASTPGSSVSLTFKRRIPEVLNFVRTRAITVRLFLCRPIFYLIVHSPIPNEQLLQIPVVAEFLNQTSESLELFSVPLSSHRHYGSWFFLRNMYCYVLNITCLYKRFGEQAAPKKKVTSFLKDSIQMYDFWLDECPDMADARRLTIQALASLDD